MPDAIQAERKVCEKTGGGRGGGGLRCSVASIVTQPRSCIDDFRHPK